MCPEVCFESRWIITVFYLLAEHFDGYRIHKGIGSRWANLLREALFRFDRVATHNLVRSGESQWEDLASSRALFLRIGGLESPHKLARGVTTHIASSILFKLPPRKLPAMYIKRSS
ncbi:hypothetical protein L917_12059 [Phytophthora nicotianae]|uniref:Uncharacterized protein n=2 Tax=Phytophthora nicotianae TaxID=4792 RepID=V9ETS2_PHYNI|nr:hypothetical protein F443_12574 [Phytophthora nicotianae P1569]ETL88910.1 hypothetical protein L917_12059 [Phytophthora nicotianae]ETM42150.1 hypothetical protein L914_12142 [Phytophthora nicotianae]